MSERLSTTGARSGDARRYLKRAGLFGAGLLLLWVALQLTPTRSVPEPPTVYSDEAGTVASRAQELPSSGFPSMFSMGNVAAVLLLGGGVAVAVYLRKRSRNDGRSAPIQSLGEFPMGPNQSLRLVACGSEVLLLGITSGQINLLRSYPSDAFPLEENEIVPAAPTHFSGVLRQYAVSSARIETNGSA